MTKESDHQAESLDAFPDPRQDVRERAPASWDGEDVYKAVFERSPVGMLLHDERGVVVECNRRLAELFGAARERYIGLNLPQTLPEGEVREVLTRCLRDGGVHVYEGKYVSQITGNRLWIRLTTSRIAPRLYVAFIEDVTGRKLAEEARERVEAVIRHDLRAPIGNVVMAASALREAPNLNEAQRNLLGLIEEGCRHAMDGLNRSMDLYKIECGRYSVEAELLDVLDLIRRIAAGLDLIEEHAGKKVELRVQGFAAKPGDAVYCLAHPAQLRSALGNLLRNALEASPAGEAVAIDVIGGPEPRLEIRNRGAVPAEIRNRFFEKFATYGKRGGTGLGAYAAKKMIEAQGGLVEMRVSDERNETILIVRLAGPPPDAS